MRKWFTSLLLAVIGSVIGWWWWRVRSSDVYQPKPTTNKTQPIQNNEVISEVATTTETAAPDEPASSHAPDDLTEVNGIGPTFAEALHEIGIRTFCDLAQQTPEELAAKLSARVTAERIQRNQWIEQARERCNNSQE
jgi:predicted flap endonuclease-1-like 5' DNA nuclease